MHKTVAEISSPMSFSLVISNNKNTTNLLGLCHTLELHFLIQLDHSKLTKNEHSNKEKGTVVWLTLYPSVLNPPNLFLVH